MEPSLPDGRSAPCRCDRGTARALVLRSDLFKESLSLKGNLPKEVLFPKRDPSPEGYRLQKGGRLQRRDRLNRLLLVAGGAASGYFGSRDRLGDIRGSSGTWCPTGLVPASGGDRRRDHGSRQIDNGGAYTGAAFCTGPVGAVDNDTFPRGGDILLVISRAFFRGRLFIAGVTHVGNLRRFGTRFFSRSQEGLPGPGDEQDEQEQDDEDRYDPPHHVYAASGLLPSARPPGSLHPLPLYPLLRLLVEPLLA